MSTKFHLANLYEKLSRILKSSLSYKTFVELSQRYDGFMQFNEWRRCVRLITHSLNGPRLPVPFVLFFIGLLASFLDDRLSSLTSYTCQFANC